MTLNRRNGMSTATSALDAACRLPTYLHQVRQGTGVEAVPQADQLAVEHERFVIRVQSACGWLRLLGYTEGTLPCERPDAPRLRAALALFQSDAGLEAHGLLDDASWSALLTLVSFDSLTDVAQFHHGQRRAASRDPRPALQRAVLLRLNVLQHTTHLPHVDMGPEELDSAVRVGLVHFSDTLRQLGVASKERRSRLRVERWLFDHDAQMEVLLRWMDGASHPDMQPWRGTPMWDAVHGLARVELYLRDYEVGRLDDTKLDRVFWQALDDERHRRGLTGQPRRRRLDGALLTAWVAEQQVSSTPEDLLDRDAHVALHTALQRIPVDIVDAEWTRLTRQRFRLWDGFRRAVRWVTQAVRQGVQWLVDNVLRPVTEGLTHLVRWLYRSACQVVTAVQDAALAFRRVLSGPLVTSAGETRVHVDFDLDSFVIAGGQAPAHAAFVRQTLEGFVVAVRILTWVGELLVLAASGGWSWLRVLRAFLTLFRQLKRHGTELQLNAEAPVPAVQSAHFI